MISLTALDGIPEVVAGDDLAALVAAALAAGGIGLTDDDVLVVTQKVVSKAEGRVVELASVTPREEARAWAAKWGKDPRQVELVLQESVEVLRMARGGLIISRTRTGLVCANAGVDVSNVGGDGPAGEAGEVATLLPLDPDASAAALRARLRELTGAAPGIVVSDSFGRPWRNGIVNVAIGCAGLEPLVDLRGTPDADGRVMSATVIAVADELASAADLAGGKVARRPVVLIRGWEREPADAAVTAEAGDGPGAAALVMDRALDLFP